MAKSSKPDRRRPNQRKREPKEFEETTISVDRVTRVVSGGRRMRFRAVVVIGNKKGKGGLGTGKANDVQSAVKKAVADAKREMINVPIVNGTIPHEIDKKFKASRIRLVPAGEGTGVIAGSSLRVILENAGIKNVLSKRYGTTNKLVNAQCTIKALASLKGGGLTAEETEPEASEDSKEVSGKKIKKAIKVEQGEQAKADEEALEGVEIKEVSTDDIDRDGNLKGAAVK